MRVSRTPGIEYIGALGLLTAVSAVLLVVGSVQAGELVYGYLAWNLFLAWVPFALALWLAHILRARLWSSWPALGVTVAWLAFLPNSFYMVSDLAHLVEADPSQALLSVVIMMSFVLDGLMLGVSSLYIVHMEIRKRVSWRRSSAIIALLLFVCSSAIYVGRDLRWNSWDILLNPFGLLFDVSERLLHPSQYPQVLAVVLPFFALLGSIYFAAWCGVRAARLPK